MKNTIMAETIRLFSTRLWLWAIIAAALCGGGFTGLLAGIGPDNLQPPMPGLDTPSGVSSVLGIESVTLFVAAIFGTVAITSEYRHRSITTTFLFSPVRWKVLAAKLLVYAVVGLAYGVILVVTAAAALYGGAALHGTSLGMSTGDVAGFMLRIVIACGVYTLVGVGIGGLVRNQIAALAIVVGYFYFVELLLMLIPGVKLAYPFLPGGATSALIGFGYLTDSISAQTGASPVHLLPPIGGGLVLLGYAALASLFAVLFPLRKDVH